MLFYLFFLKLISFTFENELRLVFDMIFKIGYKSSHVSLDYCKLYDTNDFSYRGRPTNIKNILSENKEFYNDYKYVYISELKYFENIVQFPKSTVFFALNSITQYEEQFNKEYCFINIDWNLEDYAPLYYIIIGKETDKNIKDIITAILIGSFIITNFFILIINLKSCGLKLFESIIFYNFAFMVISLLIMIGISCLIINYFLLSHLIYCMFKSYIFINLIFYVDGFMNLHYDYSRNCIFGKTLLCFFIFESICSLFFIYIIYFIPSVNNYYLFIMKSLIEHIVLLLYTIKCIIKRFIPLYKQYLFEKRFKTIIAISYKVKLYVYSKIIIFSLIYSLAFILLPLFVKIFSINDYAEVFYYNYYINVGLEIFLGFILGILFYPVKITVLYYLPVKYDYNSKKILIKIKNNENLNNISKLTKGKLKYEYKKDNLPVVLMKPFANINNNDNILLQNMIIGTIENENQ